MGAKCSYSNRAKVGIGSNRASSIESNEGLPVEDSLMLKSVRV